VNRTPRCPRCPRARLVCRWQQDRLGRRHVRGECGGCGRYLCFLPKRPPYTQLADGNSSATPILDALVECERLGIELASDGGQVYPRGGWQRVPPRLAQRIRECGHTLAQLLGNATGRASG
jgi:hypothetical protein